MMKPLYSLLHAHRQHLGIASIIIGVVLLATGMAFSWTLHNGFTACCLLLIIGGVVLHVVILKRESKY